MIKKNEEQRGSVERFRYSQKKIFQVCKDIVTIYIYHSETIKQCASPLVVKAFFITIRIRPCGVCESMHPPCLAVKIQVLKAASSSEIK
jgi:hypothetical protein